MCEEQARENSAVMRTGGQYSSSGAKVNCFVDARFVIRVSTSLARSGVEFELVLSPGPFIGASTWAYRNGRNLRA